MFPDQVSSAASSPDFVTGADESGIPPGSPILIGWHPKQRIISRHKREKKHPFPILPNLLLIFTLLSELLYF
jgi:hypothetical protein